MLLPPERRRYVAIAAALFRRVLKIVTNYSGFRNREKMISGRDGKTIHYFATV